MGGLQEGACESVNHTRRRCFAEREALGADGEIDGGAEAQERTGRGGRRESGSTGSFFSILLGLSLAFTALPTAALPATSVGCCVQPHLALKGMPHVAGMANWTGWTQRAECVGIIPLRGGAVQLEQGGNRGQSGGASKKKRALVHRVLLVALKFCVLVCGLLWFQGCAVGLWNVARAVMLPGGLEWMVEQSSHGIIGVGLFVLFTFALLCVQFYKLWNLAVATSYSEVRRSFLILALFNLFFVYRSSWRVSPGLQNLSERDLAILAETICMVSVVVLVWLKQPWRGHGRLMGGTTSPAGKRSSGKLK